MLSNRDKALLFDFLTWLASKHEVKYEYLDLIREYTEARKSWQD